MSFGSVPAALYALVLSAVIGWSCAAESSKPDHDGPLVLTILPGQAEYCSDQAIVIDVQLLPGALYR